MRLLLALAAIYLGIVCELATGGAWEPIRPLVIAWWLIIRWCPPATALPLVGLLAGLVWSLSEDVTPVAVLSMPIGTWCLLRLARPGGRLLFWRALGGMLVLVLIAEMSAGQGLGPASGAWGGILLCELLAGLARHVVRGVTWSLRADRQPASWESLPPGMAHSR